MNTIERQRCFNHSAREAVARCPECGRFYCRECVTEHEDRVLCASCIEKQASSQAKKRRDYRVIKPAAFLAAGFAILFLAFYYSGVLLMKIPTSFHKGWLW
jgi:hypothetical protein